MKSALKVLLVLLVFVVFYFLTTTVAFADSSSSDPGSLKLSENQEATSSPEEASINNTPCVNSEDNNSATSENNSAIEEETTSNPESETNVQNDPVNGTLVDPTFPVGSFVIPMDDKQADKIKAFGLIHSILTNGAYVYRVIEPPNVTLKTTIHPEGAVYRGGPMFIMPSKGAVVTAARAGFPSVTVDTLVESITSNNVFMAERQTRILVVQGQWGHTDETMDGMGLPYTLVTQAQLVANPEMIFNYDVVVDDCPGGAGGLPEDYIGMGRTYVANGGEIIFTDIALLDLDQVFPNYVTVVDNEEGTWTFTYHNTGDFLSQYYGSTTASIYTKGGGNIVSAIENSNVKILVDANSYGSTPAYRIGAFYFTYGNGVVVGFAFHPGDQSDQDAITITSVLLGNKLVHTVSTSGTPVEEETAADQEDVLPVTGESSLLLLLGVFLILLGLGVRLSSWPFLSQSSPRLAKPQVEL